jgi:hypothetical protein
LIRLHLATPIAYVADTYNECMRCGLGQAYLPIHRSRLSKLTNEVKLLNSDNLN